MTPKMREFADMAFCINLDRRPDRWQFMKRQFAKHNIEASRFAAVDGSLFPPAVVVPKPHLHIEFKAGTYASLLSHLSVVTLAKEMGLKGVWVWEDDAILDKNFAPWTDAILAQVPADWDMVYFSGRVLLGKTPINAVEPRIYRPDYMYWLVSYIIRETCYDKVIAALRTKNHWADQLVAGLHPQLNVYTPFPRPVRQSFRMGSDNKGIPPP